MSLAGLPLAVLVACYSAEPSPGLPCSAEARCPGGQTCLPAGVCVPDASGRELVLDSLEDFTAAGATAVGAVITGPGAVESQAYLTHGLALGAIASAAFTDAAAASWAALPAERSGAAVAYSSSLAWGAGMPLGLGLGRGADITVLAEGELYLEAGSWRLELRGDDQAFVELAEPGGGAYRRVLNHGGGGASTTTTENIPADGWYPVRMAVANAAGPGSLLLRGARGVAGLAVFDQSRLRARLAPETRGLVQDSFQLFGLLRWASSKLVPSITDVQLGTAVPADSGIGSASQFSLRWSGQFLVEGGLDGFTITTEGGLRLWIDGQLRADRTASGETPLTGLGIAPGWHDLVLELHKRAAGTASLRVSAPIGDPTAFTDAKLRPVIGMSQRWIGAQSGAVDALPDPPDSLSRTLTLPPIAGTALSTSAEISIDHDTQSEVSMTVTRGAVQRTLVSQGTLSGNGFTRQRFDLDPRTYPGPPGGGWTFTVADNVAAVGTGDLTSVSLTTLYRATAPTSAPFAAQASWISAPFDLGDVLYLGTATWKLLQADNAKIALSLRTGASAEECQAAPWTPLAADGTSSAAPLRFVQLRVDLESPTAAAALDRFRLQYYVR